MDELTSLAMGWDMMFKSWDVSEAIEKNPTKQSYYILSSQIMILL